MSETVDEDAELVRRAKLGEYPAYEALVAKYERPIYTLARRIAETSRMPRTSSRRPSRASWST